MMLRQTFLVVVSAVVWVLTNSVVYADCMGTDQVLQYLRGNTLSGKYIGSGKTWKAKFRAGGPVTFRYPLKKSQIYQWFVKETGIVLLSSSIGNKYKRRICRQKGRYYWTDAATGNSKSEIIKSLLGDRTEWFKGAPGGSRTRTATRRPIRVSSNPDVLACNSKKPSIKACKKLLRKEYGLPLKVIHLQLAKAYMQSAPHKMAYARSHFAKSINLDPKYTAAYAARGRVYLNCCGYREGAISTYDKAIADFTKVIKLGRNAYTKSWGYENRGLARRLRRKYKMALQDFTKAINLIPRNVNAYMNIGVIYVKINRFDSAIFNFRKAMDLAKKYGVPSKFYSLKSMRKHVARKIKEAKSGKEKFRRIQRKYQATRQACVKKYHLSKYNFGAFERRSSVSDWPDDSALSVNPYIYKGKTIGILTVFHKMLSEHEASFGKNPFGLGTEAHVSDVPSTKFQKPEVFLLAGRVAGKNGAMLALKYIDSFSCGTSLSCDNILFWKKIDKIKKQLKGNPSWSLKRMVLHISEEDENCARSIRH